MMTEKIDLYSYFGLKREQNAKGYLDTRVIQPINSLDDNRLYPSMLILPGGGYSMVSPREGDPIASEFLYNNYSCFILDYSVFPLKYPTQLLEAAMAVVYIRENAEKYFLDKNKVSAIGFSAGGHLCGCLATIFDDPNILSALGKRAKLVRPDAVILSYPVISSDEAITHSGSFENVSTDENCKKYLSLENRVSAASSPAFIWHTLDDNAVNAENSLRYALKCREHNVPFELHMFEKGVHGLSTSDIKSYAARDLSPDKQHTRKWIELAVSWLKLQGLALS